MERKNIDKLLAAKMASKSARKSGGVASIVGTLFGARTQAHVFHLQTKSYSEHMTLGAFYDEVGDLLDSLVESYQGKYGIITEYSIPGVVSYTGKGQLVSYLEGLCESIESDRVSVEDSYLQNQIDTILELVESTKYKIKNLS